MNNLDDQHFKSTARFINVSAFVVLGYVILVTFVPIPKENLRFVDISLAFLLGWMSNNSSYLTGGNPGQNKKQTQPPGTTSAEVSATITTEPKDETTI